MAVKTPRVQVGISSDPNKNFVIDASQADNTLKISRGNIGNTSQDVATISASGVVTFPAGSQMLGVGQTWQDKTSQRTFFVDYLNDTSKPIYVSVATYATNAGNSTYAVVGTVQVNNLAIPSGTISNLTFIVPVNTTYRVFTNNGSLSYWSELR